MRRMTMAGIGMALLLGACVGGGEVRSLRPNSVFDDNAPPAAATVLGDETGKNRLMPRGYAGAPPQIPHRIDEMTVTQENNDCLNCHAPDYADEKTPATPVSHLQEAAVHPARFNCTQRHVTQTDAPRLVKNENDRFAIPPLR